MTTNPGVRPAVLYKYYPVESWLPKLITGESLLFSTRVSFNDPFDCRPAFQFVPGKAGINLFKNKLATQGLSPAKSYMQAKQMERKLIYNENLVPERTDGRLDSIGVLCLTTKWDNALMWSHYARYHKGICIGFHRHIDIFKAALRVVYSDDLPVIPVPIEDRGYDGMFAKVFLTKSRCWSYEDEWRIIKDNFSDEHRDRQFRDLSPYCSVEDARMYSNQRGAGIYTFSNSAIESITLGMRISEADEHMVREAVKMTGIDIPIFKIAQPSKTYILSRELI